MDKGQEQFLGFILDRAHSGNHDELKSILSSAFEKQSDGAFSAAHVAEMAPKLLGLLKPENIAEVKDVFENFSKNLSK